MMLSIRIPFTIPADCSAFPLFCIKWGATGTPEAACKRLLTHPCAQHAVLQKIRIADFSP
jgi:hypothetical protein